MKGDDAMDYQIIAVDFDGTLCFSNWPELGEPNRPLIEYLKSQRSSGNKLILCTCRAGEALEKAVSWCRDQQLEFDAVNDNLPEIVEITIMMTTLFLEHALHRTILQWPTIFHKNIAILVSKK